MTGLTSFTTPEVRDLYWLLQSPSLISATGSWQAGDLASDSAASWVEAYVDVLQAIDRTPEDLLSFIRQQKRKRLGHYVEALLLWWLQHCPAVDGVVHALQLRDGGQTLGELDYVWFAQDQCEHWELAIKFYINTGNACDQYVGPEGRDNLARKLNHLRTHQLPMVNTPVGSAAATAALASAGYTHGGTSFYSKLLIKGWLFHPLAIWQSLTVFPEPIAADHCRGWWLRWPDAALPLTGKDHRYAVLPKARWLAPAYFAAKDAAVVSRNECVQILMRQFAQSGRAECVVELRPSLVGGWEEVSRGFILAPDNDQN